MSKPRGTSKIDPLKTLVELLTIGPDAMEARGQRELVTSASLPSDVQGREEWESLGFEFGAKAPTDPLFAPARLPDGWSKSPSDHPMWSTIMDERGRVRGQVFYKSGFHDRRAHMPRPLRCLSSRYEYENELEHVATVRHSDSEFPLHVVRRPLVSGEPVATWTRDQLSENYKIGEAVEKEARAWLEINFPRFDDPSAYWNGVVWSHADAHTQGEITDAVFMLGTPSPPVVVSPTVYECMVCGWKGTICDPDDPCCEHPCIETYTPNSEHEEDDR